MGKKVRDFIISVDFEADGPCPGINSMLQGGAVFYDCEGNVVREWEANIKELPGAVQDPGTMAWWAEQEVLRPGIWARMRENCVDPKPAMERFQSAVESVRKLTGAQPLVVAYPAGYDFTWLYWYLFTFLGKSCVGFSALDMKTMAMTLIQRSYHDSAKKRFPVEWFNPKLKHTHNALEDARGQGYTYFQMRKAMIGGWTAINEQKLAYSLLSDASHLDFIPTE